MSDKFIETSDGRTCPDDLIPRVARYGCQAEAATAWYEGRTPDAARRGLSPRFEARVFDAIERLNAGESNATVREIHGGAVLRQSLADIAVRCGGKRERNNQHENGK